MIELLDVYENNDSIFYIINNFNLLSQPSHQPPSQPPISLLTWINNQNRIKKNFLSCVLNSQKLCYQILDVVNVCLRFCGFFILSLLYFTFDCMLYNSIYMTKT